MEPYNGHHTDGFNSKGKKYALIAVGCLAAVIAAYFLREVYGLYLRLGAGGVQFSNFDFSAYYSAAGDFLAGTSVYTSNPDLFVHNYIYPPPSILLFTPFAYVSPVTGISLLAIVSLLLLVWCTYQWAGFAKRNYLLCILPFALASGPFYENLISGQINCVVLFFSTMYVVLALQKRARLAGLFLALGFWLKIYPLFICVPALLDRSLRPSVFYCAAWIAVIPILLAPVVPLSSYQVYFFEFMPALSAKITTMYNNMSAVAEVMRVTHGLDIHDLLRVPLTPKLRISFGVVYVAVATLMSYVVFRRGKQFFPCAAAILLGLLPVVSPIGWGHHYVLATPLLILAIVYSEMWVQLGVALFAWGCLVIPPHRLFSAMHLPDASVLEHVYYMRYACAVLLLIGAVLHSRFRSGDEGNS